VKILHTDLSALALDECYPLLSESERIRATVLTESMRRRFVASRAFRRRILGADAEILTEKNGRPYIKGDPLFFSMSHTGDFLVMAIDAQPVGIDAEFMKERNFAKISSRFFGENIPTCEAFYRRWTRFEASLKLVGLTLFSRDVPEPAYIHSEVIGNCMLSVASNFNIGIPQIGSI
jgi:phosphopantetheinyl transferase